MPAAARRAKARSSRYSSPKVTSSTITKPVSTTGEWTEPTPKDARPSYEEHGGSPFGVLEDMQALGLPPTAKVRARVRAEPLRKSLGRNFGAGQDLGRMAEESPSLDTPRSSSVPKDNLEAVSQPEPEAEHENGVDPRKSRHQTRSRRTRGSSVTSDGGKLLPEEGTRRVSLTPKTSPMPDTTSTHATTEVSENDIERVNFHIVVDIAVNRANALGFLKFGAALKHIYAESQTNERYTHLLRAVLLQSASESEKVEFTAAIKRAKRTLRKSASGEVDSAGVNGTRHRSGSLPDASRPELVARPSIEEVPKVPKLRLSMRRRSGRESEGKKEDPTERSTPRSTRRGQLTQRSRTSSVSSVSSEAEVIISAARADAARVGRSSSNATGKPGPKIHLTNGSGAMKHTQPRMNGSASHDISRSSESSEQFPAFGTRGSSDGIAQSGQESGIIDTDSKEDQPMTDISANERRLKRSSANAELDGPQLAAIEATKRRKLQETLHKDPGPAAQYAESRVRETIETTRSTRSGNGNGHGPTLRLGNGSANTRPRRGRDATDSPLSDMSTPPPPPLAHESMAETLATRTKTKAKIKQSPEKKPRPVEGSGGRIDSSPAGGEADNDSDNNDYCNSCGGTGFLLCCDGCDKAFHFSCVDPPLDANSSALDEPWFCPSCVARRNPPPRQPRGLFSALLHGLEKRNPTIFALPESLRSYYANVWTGKDGKFDDVANVKTRTRAGYDEPLDTLKTRDGKGNSILCYACGLSSAGKREIITCDVCGNHWHLDCTNPPLANPPFRDQHNRKTKEWMCPLHVEHDLAAIDPVRLSRRRRVHVRRPKVARTTDTALRRGMMNSGIIEIAEDSSSEEDSDFEEEDDDDDDASGIIYRLPAKGIKLDFIDKVHRIRAVEASLTEIPPPKATRMTAKLLQAELDSRPVIERQLLLSLVQMGSTRKDVSLTGDAIQGLINALTVEAPPEVVGKVAEDEDVEMSTASGLASPPASYNSASDLSDGQRRQLEALQQLIAQRLGAAPGS